MLSAARLVKHARFAGFPAVAGCALGAPGGPRRPACRLPLQGWPGLRGQLRGLSARARARRFVAKRDVFCSAGSPNAAFCEVFCEAPSQNTAFRDVFCHAHKPNAAFRDAFCAPSCQTRVFREVCCWRPAGSWMCSAACGALRERCCCSAGWGCAATCAGSVRARRSVEFLCTSLHLVRRSAAEHARDVHNRASRKLHESVLLGCLAISVSMDVVKTLLEFFLIPSNYVRFRWNSKDLHGFLLNSNGFFAIPIDVSGFSSYDSFLSYEFLRFSWISVQVLWTSLDLLGFRFNFNGFS